MMTLEASAKFAEPGEKLDLTHDDLRQVAKAMLKVKSVKFARSGMSPRLPHGRRWIRFVFPPPMSHLAC